jgi:hypothetical protein
MLRPRPAEVIGGDRAEAQALERRRCERRCYGRRCCGGQAGGAWARRSCLIGQAEAVSMTSAVKSRRPDTESARRAETYGLRVTPCLRGSAAETTGPSRLRGVNTPQGQSFSPQLSWRSSTYFPSSGIFPIGGGVFSHGGLRAYLKEPRGSRRSAALGNVSTGNVDLRAGMSCCLCLKPGRDFARSMTSSVRWEFPTTQNPRWHGAYSGSGMTPTWAFMLIMGVHASQRLNC